MTAYDGRASPIWKEKFVKFLSVIAIAMLTASTSSSIAGNLQDIREPTKTQGVSLSVLEKNALVEQIPAMKGYDFRARRITFIPGASFTKHNHKTRPGIVYVEKGTIIENRNGVSRKFRAGDTWIEDAQTDHWLRNVSKSPAVIIMIDLPVQK